jgi:hypothetical protein
VIPGHTPPLALLLPLAPVAAALELVVTIACFVVQALVCQAQLCCRCPVASLEGAGTLRLALQQE